MTQEKNRVTQDLSAHEKGFINNLHEGINHNKRKYCRCPNCGYKEPAELTVPCHHKRCPRCESPLIES